MVVIGIYTCDKTYGTIHKSFLKIVGEDYTIYKMHYNSNECKNFWLSFKIKGFFFFFTEEVHLSIP